MSRLARVPSHEGRRGEHELVTNGEAVLSDDQPGPDGPAEIHSGPEDLVSAASAWVVENGDWLEQRRHEMVSDLAIQLEEVADGFGEAAPIDVVVQAGTAGWPIEISAFWVARCLRLGSTWVEVASALGLSRQAAHERFSEWVARFRRAALRMTVPEAGASRRPGSRDAAGSDRELAAGLAPGTTSFVGRRREMDQLAGVLGRHRLVTLVGTPGVGKSRLALEMARRYSLAKQGQAWLVELGAVTEPSRLPPAVTAALAMREQPGRTPAETIIEHLRSRTALLVLDSCEHLADACRALASQLLDACPGLVILATSQQPLGLESEQVWPLEGLPCTDQNLPAGDGEPDAVLLFWERAMARRPDVEVTADMRRVSVEICQHLDGNPLAIELAAARLGSLGPAEFADLLEDRFRLLTGGDRGAPARHRSLRAAFDWSYELLDQPERALLRRLSVFAGSPARDAVEAVCTGAPMPRDGALDVLASLVAKSLVVLAEVTGPRTRYRLLETVRRYGMDRLIEAGEEDRVRFDHLRWCVQLAERAEPEMTGADQGSWLSRLDQEHGELLHALSWATAQGAGEEARQLAGALTLYWRVRGSFTDGRYWLEASLAAEVRCPHAPDDGGRAKAVRAKAVRAKAVRAKAVRAKALWGAGFLSLMLSDVNSAQSRVEASLALYQDLNDIAGEARCLLLLGNLSQCRSEAEEALALLGRSTLLAREVGDSWCLAHALALSGRTLADRGELDPARVDLEECIEVARSSGDSQSLRIGLIVLGDVTMSQGEYDLAEALLAEGLAVTKELGEEHGVAAATSSLGELAAARGDFGRARTLLEEALVLARQAGDPRSIGHALCAVGELHAAMGDPVAAREHFAEAASRSDRLGITRGAASLGLARAAAAVDRRTTARSLLLEVILGARGSGDKLLEGDALEELAGIVRTEGDLRRSARLFRQVLVLRDGAGDLPGLVASLEDLAGVAVASGSWEHAARLLGGAQALRDAHGFFRPPARQPGYDADLAALEDASAAEEVRVAWAHGATMSVADLVRCARAGRGGSRALGGWASLTRAEREVVDLAAQGLTNQEIGARLFLSRHTVASHLAGAYPKLGIRSRRELAGLHGGDGAR